MSVSHCQINEFWEKKGKGVAFLQVLLRVRNRGGAYALSSVTSGPHVGPRSGPIPSTCTSPSVLLVPVVCPSPVLPGPLVVMLRGPRGSGNNLKMSKARPWTFSISMNSLSNLRTWLDFLESDL